MSDRELLRYLSEDCWVRAWGSTRYADDISVVAWWGLLQGWLVRRVEHDLYQSKVDVRALRREGVTGVRKL